MHHLWSLGGSVGQIVPQKLFYSEAPAVLSKAV